MRYSAGSSGPIQFVPDYQAKTDFEQTVVVPFVSSLVLRVVDSNSGGVSQKTGDSEVGLHFF